MTGYQVLELPLSEVYDDPKFNCRHQELGKGDVLDLIESIKRTRLENPIVVQPVADITPITPPPDGVKYRVLNGNRRFVAMRCLNKEFPDQYATIPAIIRQGLSDDEARGLNISDNLDRKNLTLEQEALALQPWFKVGYPRETVGRMIGQSGSWVQIRYNLLQLPDDLREYAGKGLIGQDDVKDLYRYRTDIDALYTRAKEIIAFRLRGQTPPKIKSRRQQARAKTKARSRPNGEILEMLDHVADNVGCGLITRALAWSAGNVTTFDLLAEIKQVTETLDKKYRPLDEDTLRYL